MICLHDYVRWIGDIGEEVAVAYFSLQYYSGILMEWLILSLFKDAVLTVWIM